MRLVLFGTTLTIISWIISWGRIAPFYEHSFFSLWLGYILTINGLSMWLFGKSLLSKMGPCFILLFLISIPFWWFFELLNLFTHNWQYIFPHSVSALEYFLRASIAFSTVIPAVLSTSFLARQALAKTKPLKTRPFFLTRRVMLPFLITGVFSLFLIPTFPHLSFPLLWLGIFLIFDPVNYLLNFSSLLGEISKGRWILLVALSLATLFVGFWWEMWNFYSLPKWVYSIPYAGGFKIFEMPILGFLGYLPFGLEVYSFTVFCLGLLQRISKIKVPLNL